jgi:beta-galactosidase
MRQTLNFNENWSFIKKDVGFEEASKTAGEPITLPHTWNGLDGQDGGGDYYRGTCFYVKRFLKPEFKDGQQAFLEFRGVNAEAEVRLNGQQICTHRGGYSAFRGEITPYLKENNTLIVSVSNQETEEVYPQKADFTFYGGIYRDVSLIITEACHFDLLHLADAGFRAEASVRGLDGILTVTASPIGGGEIKAYVLDQAGKTVTVGQLGAELRIESVHLWDGVKDPYLYKVRLVLSENGEEKDTVETAIGFRSFSVDPQKGFILNGRPYPLRGVSRHQDRPGKGNALAQADHEEDIRLILESGANTVRLAHYQHDDYFYTLCDEKGLIVWSEIPYISRHMEPADGNAVSQMEELISQTYHHPSICFRGLSNEITISHASADRMAFHKKLNELVHREDPSRLTTLASYMGIGDLNRLNFLTDVFSFNLYYGWYIPGTFLNSVRFSIFHFFHPHRPVGLSEYGAEGMANLHSAHPRRFDNSEEYQALYHEKMLKIISKRPYLWATHLWNMFDFGADGRNQGGEAGRNHKGLVTFDRQTKKDAFYIYKAYWSDEPFLHLCSQRFINRTGNKTLVKVYSNQPEVSLLVNGKLFKAKRGDKIFKFIIPLEAETVVQAVSGTLQEEMTIRKVQQKDPSYLCPKSNSYSWEKKKAKK